MPVVSRQDRGQIQAGPAARKAISKLRDQGIDMLHGWAPQPRHDPPQIPRDLPALPDAELMDLFRQASQWQKHIRLQLAAAEIDESSAAAAASTAQAIALGRSGAKTVTQMKADARDDAAYAAAEALHAEAYAYRKLVLALFENLDRDCFLLSRELSRRTAEAPSDRRTGRR